MMKQVYVHDFDSWRAAARTCLASEILPEQISWDVQEQASLFEEVSPHIPSDTPTAHVSKAFMSLAKSVACYRDTEKWGILYRTLWRLTHGERHLLEISTDKDVLLLYRMAKEIGRDVHKMHAFVRFRAVEGQENHYIAWHEPTHLIVRRAAPFFQRRFAAMRWAILTPDDSVRWDGKTLEYFEGMPRSAAPVEDEMEELWKVFYRNIFNPARIKTNMMKSEMPVKYWHTMPETALIPDMLNEADARVRKMIALQQENQGK